MEEEEKKEEEEESKRLHVMNGVEMLREAGFVSYFNGKFYYWKRERNSKAGDSGLSLPGKLDSSTGIKVG